MLLLLLQKVRALDYHTAARPPFHRVQRVLAPLHRRAPPQVSLPPRPLTSLPTWAPVVVEARAPPRRRRLPVVSPLASVEVRSSVFVHSRRASAIPPRAACRSAALYRRPTRTKTAQQSPSRSGRVDTETSGRTPVALLVTDLTVPPTPMPAAARTQQQLHSGCARAVLSLHLEALVLRWARQEHCPWEPRKFRRVASGNQDMLALIKQLGG